MELLEAHKLRLGQVVVVQVEKNIILSFLVFCHLITLNSFFNTQKQRIFILVLSADQIEHLFPDRFDQESKALLSSRSS